MLTIMIHAKVKADQLDEFIELAALLTRETRGKRPGCLGLRVQPKHRRAAGIRSV